VNYLSDEQAAREVVSDVAVLGGRALPVQADVSVEADIVRLFDTAEKQLGPITGLVNNAGITGGLTSVADLGCETLRQVMDLNVIGAILCAREGVRRMSLARGGNGGGIVNVSSGAATLGSANEYVHYAASKGAIDSFTLGLAREVAGEGIRVNAVSPGLIETAIHAAGGAPDRLERLAPTVPMGRSGTADEVAQAIVWLLSDAASFVTGANLRIGGGR
jgi:NAD(P)-dependent dehydrogenase (short-subunit alcohol dehydrogenase family)